MSESYHPTSGDNMVSTLISMEIADCLRERYLLTTPWLDGAELYTLDADGNPRREHDQDAWLEWFKDIKNRLVAVTPIDYGWANRGTDAHVSTVFLGYNHRFEGDGAPLLYETIACVNGEYGSAVQCDCRSAANAQHEATVAKEQGIRN